MQLERLYGQLPSFESYHRVELTPSLMHFIKN